MCGSVDLLSEDWNENMGLTGMKRRTVPAFLGAVSLTAAVLAVPMSASADEEYRQCHPDAGVTGATEDEGQITYLAGMGLGHCGKLGIRVKYGHVGGYSWTSWKYSAYGADYVKRDVGRNAIKSRHSTSIGDLLWTSHH